jgi:hypothetical protein
MTTNGTNKRKGISRMDAGSIHGWFLRVYPRGEVYRKFLSDSVFGRGEAAFQAAIPIATNISASTKSSTCPSSQRR